jgi:cyclopropane fatty-acyl-phospholipid synthase-like methyltransferase
MSHEGRRWTSALHGFLFHVIAGNERIRSVSFWDDQARWQKAWLAHCDYHQEIIALVSRCIAPGWRVLDIGAGSGILTLPLKELQCEVSALEPSRGMQALLILCSTPRPGPQ